MEHKRKRGIQLKPNVLTKTVKTSFPYSYETFLNRNELTFKGEIL